ncbi:MAG: polysaccharide biosynthesis protein [Clostridia bacterium]|nr:polysaccharide biosynthesis protein [Clostridia bacterium]
MRKINDIKKQSFMTNVAIILFSQVMIKLLGMVYRLVITNVRGFGDAGNGYFSAGFQIYTLLLAVSSVGIPNAIAKMVSERTALGDYKGAHKIFKTAFFLFAFIGVLASVILFVGAEFISVQVIKMEGAKYTLMSLAPSIFFVCVSSVIRGYFSGLENMKATSQSQVLEQIFKCFATILIVYMLIGQPPEIMAAGANFSSSVSTGLSFLYLYVFYTRRKKAIWQKVRSSTVESPNKPIRIMIKSILMISIPISLGSIITAINRIIDTATITRGIETAFAAGIPGKIGIPTPEELNREAVRLAGILSKSDVLINMPLALNIAFSTVLVPSVSGALALGKVKEAANKVSYSLLISILLIMPCAIGYTALAKPIYMLLYPNAKLGFELLQLSSVALIFTALNQTISGSLQGMGKVFVPATGLFFGCIAKIILNIVLIRQPHINIAGAAISSIVCQMIAFGISFGVLSRNLPIKIGFIKYVLKPILASAAMGGIAVLSYRGLMFLFRSNTISTLLAIALSAAVYFSLVLALKIMTREEILFLPMGGRILAFLEKIKIY